jgi:hypothetical protein
VFPAVSIDSWIFNNEAISTYTADGLIPYGAVLQVFLGSIFFYFFLPLGN